MSVCTRCGGQKKVPGMGSIPSRCPDCLGTGRLKDHTHEDKLVDALKEKADGKQAESKDEPRKPDIAKAGKTKRKSRAKPKSSKAVASKSNTG